MVHALEAVHCLLKPGGALIDIHPIVTPRLVEVWIDGQAAVAARLRDRYRFSTYHQADAALARAVANGWFVIEQERRFTFRVHADTLADLREYLAQGELVGTGRPRTTLNRRIAGRIEKLLHRPGRDKEIILHRPAHIMRLRRV
jgi:hypothetical protein